MIKLKPAEGKKIFDPNVKDFLPKEGREVELNTYWRRRIVDKDVIIFKTEKKSETAGKKEGKMKKGSKK